MSTELELLDPVRTVDIGGEQVQVRELRWLDALQFLQKLAGGIEKTALALKLFGKEGVSMIPLLNSGAAGIRAMTDEARAFGVFVAPEAAMGASLLRDNVRPFSGDNETRSAA